MHRIKRLAALEKTVCKEHIDFTKTGLDMNFRKGEVQNVWNYYHAEKRAVLNCTEIINKDKAPCRHLSLSRTLFWLIVEGNVRSKLGTNYDLNSAFALCVGWCRRRQTCLSFTNKMSKIESGFCQNQQMGWDLPALSCVDAAGKCYSTLFEQQLCWRASFAFCLSWWWSRIGGRGFITLLLLPTPGKKRPYQSAVCSQVCPCSRCHSDQCLLDMRTSLHLAARENFFFWLKRPKTFSWHCNKKGEQEKRKLERMRELFELPVVPVLKI